MDKQSKVHNGIRLYILFAVVLGVFQMVRYQMAERSRSEEPAANATNVEANNTQEAVAESSSTLSTNIQVFATMRLEPSVREVLQSNGLEATILSYELKGVDWFYNICVNYGHILVAMIIYNKFKEGGNEGGRKFKLLALGAIVVFGWIYLANSLAIERVAVKSKTGRLMFHADNSFTRDRFDEFVKEHKDQFTVKKSEAQTAASSASEQAPIDQSASASEAMVDEEGNVFSDPAEEEF